MKDPTNKQLVFFGSAVPFNGFIHMALAGAICRNTDADAAIAFYVSAWFYSQSTNQALKNVFWRRRPTACSCLNEDEGLLAPRHFPQFKEMLLDRPDCLESFPSGDAAGAGAFGYSVMLFTGNPLWLVATLAGCFGRVFLHVHHLLDVTVGAFLGFAAAYHLDWLIEGGCRKCNAIHLAWVTGLSLLVFMLVVPFFKRRKRKQQAAKGIEWKHH